MKNTVAIIRIPRLWPGAQRTRRATAAAAAAVDSDGLDAFGSEEISVPPSAERDLSLVPPPVVETPGRRVPLVVLKWAVVVAVTALAAGGSMWAYQRRAAGASPPSRLTVETTPAGLNVSIGGQSKGRTPLTLDLPPGSYVVEIGTGSQQRVLHATLAAGTTLVERVEIAPAAVTGSLRVETEPSGLPVLIDGVNKGISPLTIAELSPGDYRIAVAAAGTVVRRDVSVRPNQTASLIISAIERPNVSGSGGWLSVTAPVLLQLRLDDKLIGSTELERVMLPAGDHTLELVNDALGYRAQRRVSIAPGKTARLALKVPEGTLSINAQPWAEVWLDGRRLGETPLGNVSAPIGSHELLFRHPELGERRAIVSIGLKKTARIGVDMRKK